MPVELFPTSFPGSSLFLPREWTLVTSDTSGHVALKIWVLNKNFEVGRVTLDIIVAMTKITVPGTKLRGVCCVPTGCSPFKMSTMEKLSRTMCRVPVGSVKHFSRARFFLSFRGGGNSLFRGRKREDPGNEGTCPRVLVLISADLTNKGFNNILDPVTWQNCSTPVFTHLGFHILRQNRFATSLYFTETCP